MRIDLYDGVYLETLAMDYSSSTVRFAERRLQRAANRVRDNWIPIDEAALKVFLRKSYESNESLETAALIEFLQSDLSLYLFSVLRLFKVLAETDQELPDSLSLSDLIEKVGVDMFLDLLNIEAVQCSRFKFEEATQSANDRLQEAALAATISQSCAALHAINSDEAFCVSMVRQLGMLLIAWNYPGLYEEALFHVSNDLSCEDWLTTELGFTPSELALQVCISDVSDVHGYFFEQYLDDELFAEYNEDLFHLCLLGEVLSKARFPEYYTLDRSVLADAYTQLDIFGGEQLVQEIQQVFEVFISRHSCTASIAQRPGLTEFWRPWSIEKNQVLYHQYVPEALRTGLSEFYALLFYEVEAKRLLHLFMNELVSAASFDAGALFIYDDVALELVRRAATGSLLPSVSEIIPCDGFLTERNSIGLAFDTESVLFEYHANQEGQPLVGCSVSFGISARLGVLYLQSGEIPADLESEKIIVERVQLLKKALEEILVVATG